GQHASRRAFTGAAAPSSAVKPLRGSGFRKIRVDAKGLTKHNRYGVAVLGRTAVTSGALFQNVRDVYAERGRQVVLMLLLLADDGSDLLRQRVVAQRFRLPDAFTVLLDGLSLVIQVKP